MLYMYRTIKVIVSTPCVYNRHNICPGKNKICSERLLVDISPGKIFNLLCMSPVKCKDHRMHAPEQKIKNIGIRFRHPQNSFHCALGWHFNARFYCHDSQSMQHV